MRVGKRKREVCLVLLLFVYFIISGTTNTYAEVEESFQKETYTLLVYMNGSDLESEGGNASLDIVEMLKGDIDEHLNVLIYTGGTSQWKSTDYNLPLISATENQLWKMENNELKLVKSYGHRNMMEASSLSDFIIDAHQMYPADHFGLILWNHGGGPIYGYGSDENHNRDSLEMNELVNALEEGKETTDSIFDFIGFDACLMASYEVVHAVSPYCDYFIGSEDAEPAYGWDYKSLVSYISENSTHSGENIGKKIIDDYYDFSIKQGMESFLTLSLIDTRKMESLNLAFEALCKKMSEELTEERMKELIGARAYSESYGSFLYGSYGLDLVDMDDFLSRIEIYYPEEVKRMKTAIDECVIYNLNSIGNPRATGLTFYFPYTRYTSAISAIEMYKNTGFSPMYQKFLEEYYRKAIQSGLTFEDFIDSEDTFSYGDDELFNDVVGMYIFQEPTTTGLNEVTVDLENSEYSITLTKEENDNFIVSNRFGIVSEDEETIFYLGDTYCHGRFDKKTRNYKLYGYIVDEWLTFNGEFVQFSVVSLKYGATEILYRIALDVNDQSTSLFFELNKGDKTPNVLGYLTDNKDFNAFVSDRDISLLSQLKSGDVIQHIQHFSKKDQLGFNQTGVLYKEPVVIETIDIKWESLKEKTYAVSFSGYSDKLGHEESDWKFITMSEEHINLAFPVEKMLFQGLDETTGDAIDIGFEPWCTYDRYKALDNVYIYDDSYIEYENVLEKYPGKPSGWAKRFVGSAILYNLLPSKKYADFQAKITREEFCELVITMFERVAKIELIEMEQPFQDTNNESVLKAYQLGIVGGYGNGMFYPDKTVNREQLMAMLYRAALLANRETIYYNFADMNVYSDSDTISPWAIDAVNTMINLGVVNGSNGKINPKKEATVEQSIKMVFNLFSTINYMAQEK